MDTTASAHCLTKDVQHTVNANHSRSSKSYSWQGAFSGIGVSLHASLRQSAVLSCRWIQRID